MEAKSFHLVMESDSKETLSNLVGAAIRETFPENSLLMVSCCKSSGQYRASLDLEERPEPVLT
jgi:hypothetical protein